MTDTSAGAPSSIVRSPVPDVDIPSLSVTDYVFRTAPDGDDRIAIIDASYRVPFDAT
jgi:hypothetical protein